MGKIFSWHQFINSLSKNEKNKKPYSKRTLNQIKECLILDKLSWIQKSKKPLPDSLEKVDKNWYCQVMKGAKYSKIGHSFVDTKQNVKCVIIERPDMNISELINKPNFSMRKQTIKYELKIESKPLANGKTWTPPLANNVDQSSVGDISLVSASVIVQEPQKHSPNLEITSSCFSNSETLYQTSSENLDILNYDFSFTFPPVKS